MKKENIIIAAIKPWNISNALKFKKIYGKKCNVFIFKNKKDMTYSRIKRINPEYIFFPHWSWIIPKEVYKNFNCVIFHMTDLPYGRGGSPLQNLILNKTYNTKISALKACGKIDAGDIYLKEKLYIGEESAQSIFKNASEIIFFKMMPYILGKKPKLKKQKGKITVFKRRRPEESDIRSSNASNLNDLYDFIRMLDAQGYPRAFFYVNNLKIELFDVCRKTNKITGKFEVINESR